MQTGGEHATAGNTDRGVLYSYSKPGIGAGEPVTEERFWRYCANCHGLFHVKGDAEAVEYGRCNHAKTGTAHVVEAESSEYILARIEGSPAEAEKAAAYFECRKCAGLYHPWLSGTACNAGGQHKPFGDKYYTLSAEPS